MEENTYKKIIEKHASDFRHLSDHKKYIVASCVDGGLLGDFDCERANAGIFLNAAEEAFTTLLESDFLLRYPHPVLIDFKKAIDLYQASELTGEDRIKSAVLMARVNFMGTDGIRGKVSTDSSKGWLAAFVKNNALTPELIATATFSFATLLYDQGVCKKEDFGVLGNDGRDVATGWALTGAGGDGFCAAGMNVLDIGVIPTAMVPYLMMKKNMRFGAMITASHNPSNQNGIKFFLDGKKLLPEGALGDFALSAYMYRFVKGIDPHVKKGTVTAVDFAIAEGVSLALSALPENCAAALQGVALVVDTANGASKGICDKVFSNLGVVWTSRNEEPCGANINRGCGVGEIEGIESFHGDSYSGHIPFIQELFDRGRGAAEGETFGISMDGDGDRGFLLVYDKKTDTVHVIDGDKCGYILARYFIWKKGLDPKNYWFVSTIESDLMTAASAEHDLGLHSRVVSVGDKWIAHFNEGELLIGMEVSGHCIFPLRFIADSGQAMTLLSGFGLLTGLATLVAVREMHLSINMVVEPFTSGFSKTWYTFFVDKSKFYKGSGIWLADRRIVEETIRRLSSGGTLGADMRGVVEEKEDPNVLYISLVNDHGLQGCVFMRNSGTEDKTATYVKGKPRLKDALLEIGSLIQENHIRLLKNKNRPEYNLETAILSALEDNKEVDYSVLKKNIEHKIGNTWSDSDFHHVVHGLKKEGRVISHDVDAVAILRLA